MAKPMTIGSLTKQPGVRVETIRFYERKGPKCHLSHSGRSGEEEADESWIAGL